MTHTCTMVPSDVRALSIVIYDESFSTNNWLALGISKVVPHVVHGTVVILHFVRNLLLLIRQCLMFIVYLRWAVFP